MTRPTPPDSVPLEAWQPITSGNAQLQLTPVRGRIPALRMDFDFRGGLGFVVARRAWERSMPREYAVNLRMRGRGPLNDLELKLVDATGRNVWRHVLKNLELPERWRTLRIDSRDIDFAWGPSSGGELEQLGSIELAVVAGQGGKGTLWIADLRFEDCTPAAPALTASSEAAGFEASKALSAPGWRPLPDDPRPWIMIDGLQSRSFGGLVVEWTGGAPAGGFRVSASGNGRRFRMLYTASRAGGARSNVYLPGLQARFLRLELFGPSAGAVLHPQPFDFSRSIDAFWFHIAAREARAWNPRWLHREQSMWTPVGTSNGIHCALLNEDGMVEVDQGSFSIEPMLRVGERLYTWADVVPQQELRERFLPEPAVVWETAEWRLRIEAQATVSHGLRVRYRVDNLTDRDLSARLFAVLRPFQVTPPWQKFRNLGGAAPIRDLSWRDGAVQVNGTMIVAPCTDPDGFGCLSFDEGFIAPHLAAGALPGNTEVQDSFGFATGALDFRLELEPGESCERVLNCVSRDARPWVFAPAFDWSGRLPAGQWGGNGWVIEAVQAALTATAHILITRSGPALQPGPRRYTRSWIRDGAIMGAALLRMGHADEVRDFIRWYAPNQRSDGFVPCCVDSEGIDWLVEHDSHGQLIALVADHYRFTSDRGFLEESWPCADRAAGCIERLLGEDGLLPISASHEGYLAQPVHSYWDDFWALRGLRDAGDLARALGLADSAQRWDALAKRLAASVFASIAETRAKRHLDFIPGSVEWADFDPTATANALYLLDIPPEMDRPAVARTFDAYLADWRAKRQGTLASPNYTPYEIRIIGALVRLGRRDAALELLRFFLSDRQPPAWNQWPEIVWLDRRSPAHIGDLPHTWISAEFVLAVRSLFAYERETDASLVVAAGLAGEWLDGAGVQVNGMPTCFGSLSYALRRIDSRTLQCEIVSRIAARVVLRPPLPGTLRSVTVNGAEHGNFDGESVIITETPADIRCSTF